MDEKLKTIHAYTPSLDLSIDESTSSPSTFPKKVKNRDGPDCISLTGAPWQRYDLELRQS